MEMVTRTTASDPHPGLRRVGRALASLGITLFRYLPGFLWLLIALFSVGWLIMTSLKTNQEIFAGIWNLPKALYLGGYVRALQQMKMGYFLMNSAILSIVVVLALDIIAAMAAYVLTRFHFRGSRLMLLYFIAGMAIPGLLIVVPLYLWLGRLALLDSLPGLGLVYVAVSLPFSIFVLTGFFKSLPSEIIDAALVDGSSDFGVFWSIALPLAKPGIVTITIFNFLGVWNEYLLALTILQTDTRMTLPLGLYKLRMQQQMATDWTSVFSGVVLALVPSLVIFLLLQERLAAGLTTGALKG